MKPRHGIHSNYRLDGPPGALLGRIAFHPGTAAVEPDGSYVIGEFRPDKGEPLPIAVRVEKDKRPNSFPTGEHVSRNHLSVVATYNQLATELHYVLFYEGDLAGTTSSGSQNVAMNTWVDEGAVKLRNGRTFGYRREALYPDELHINGTAYDLRKGRVLVLYDDGTVAQLNLFPVPSVARDPEVLAKQIEASSAAKSQFGPVIERVITHPADATKNYFLDLDSGNFVAAPEAVFDLLRNRFDEVTKTGRTDEPIKNWARTSGADLSLAFTSPDVTLALYGGVIVFPMLSFEAADAREVLRMAEDALQQQKRDGKAMPPLTMFHRHEPDREGAFVFHTREGGIGLLQIVSSTENPRSVKIHYKLLATGTGEKTSRDEVKAAPLFQMPPATGFQPPASKEPSARETRTFSLRHKLARNLVEQLRQLLQGRPGQEARASPDDQEITVTAPPEVMTRVQTFITATDWPDTLDRGKNFEYPRLNPLVTARAFFYACAIEDSAEAISKLLSVGVLAELKGETDSQHYKDYQMGGVPDARWEASLRADWPNRKELLRLLAREWNRHPLTRIVEDPGVAIGFGRKHSCTVSFEGELQKSFHITIEPDRTRSGPGEDSYFFSSLPPGWPIPSALIAVPAAHFATKPGTYDIKPGLKLVITGHKDGKTFAEKPGVAAELVWEWDGDPKLADRHDIPLSDGLPYVVAWRAGSNALWVSCASKSGAGTDEKFSRYLRVLTVRAPGDVEERTISVGRPESTDAADLKAFEAVPADVRRAFEALGK
jgi:hypothetical protein